jgi:hypothetical protein
MIVETTDNKYWQVRETGNPDLAHVWIGQELSWKKSSQTFIKRIRARPQLVSKNHVYRIIEP